MAKVVYRGPRETVSPADYLNNTPREDTNKEEETFVPFLSNHGSEEIDLHTQSSNGTNHVTYDGQTGTSSMAAPEDGIRADNESVMDEKNSDLIEPQRGGALDGGYGWFIILGSTLAQLISGGLERSRGVLFLEMQSRFESSAQITAWVVSLTATVRLCGGPLASQLVDRFSCRWVVFVSGFITSLSFILCCFAGSLEYMFFSLGILSGVGRMCMYAPSVVIVGLYFDKRRGLAAGLSSAGVGIGTFILPPAIQAAFDNYGWFGAFIIMAGVSLHACICGALFRPLQLQWKILERNLTKKECCQPDTPAAICDDSYTDNHHIHQAPSSIEPEFVTHQLLPNSNVATATGKKSSGLRARIRSALESRPICQKENKKRLFYIQLLKDPFFLTYCISLFLFSGAFQSGVIFIPVYAKEQGNSLTQAALLLSIMGVADTIGRVVVGFVFDLPMIKPRRLYYYNAIWFCLAIVCVLIPHVQEFWEFAVIVSIFGFLTAAVVGQKSVVIVDILGADTLVHSFGWILLFQGVANLIVPPMAGMLRDLYGTYTNALYGSGGLIALAATILMCGNICAAYGRKKTALKQNDIQLSE